MSALLASVLLALVSAVCYAAAAIVQERLAATTSPSRYGLLRHGRWWLALALNCSGALLHVAALGLGPLTVVQPLGVLTLVLAAPMAALLVKRPVSVASWRGILLTSAGLAGVLLLTGPAGPSGARPLQSAEQVLVAVAVLGALGALLLAATAAGRRAPLVRSVSLATAAGVAYGAASVFVKTVAESWTLSSTLTTLPVVLLIAALALAGLATSQSSYRGGGLTTPLATATVVNPVVAAAVGILLLEEGFKYGVPGGLAAVGSGIVAACGLVLLAADSAARDEHSHATGHGQGGAVPTPAGSPAPLVIPSPVRAPGAAFPAPGPARRAGAGAGAGAGAAIPAVTAAEPTPPVEVLGGLQTL